MHNTKMLQEMQDTVKENLEITEMLKGLKATRDLVANTRNLFFVNKQVTVE